MSAANFQIQSDVFFGRMNASLISQTFCQTLLHPKKSILEFICGKVDLTTRFSGLKFAYLVLQNRKKQKNLF
jgi:hypothetical protein